MLKIHIVRNRQPVGEFTPSEVSEGLKSGKFLPTDLGWREPMDNWLPLSDFPGVAPKEEPIVPPPLDFVEGVPVSEEDGPAWERPGGGSFKRLLVTVRQIMVEPGVTFRAMKANGDYRAPLTFFLIMAIVCNWVSLAYQVIAIASGLIPWPSTAKATPELLIGTAILGVIFVPIILLAIAFVMSGVFHLVLHAIGGAKKGFEATFRAYCYSFGAASIMLLVPLLGMVVAMVMGVGFLIIGLKELHGIKTRQALAGVFPVALAWAALYFALSQAAAALSGL